VEVEVAGNRKLMINKTQKRPRKNVNIESIQTDFPLSTKESKETITNLFEVEGALKQIKTQPFNTKLFTQEESDLSKTNNVVKMKSKIEELKLANIKRDCCEELREENQSKLEERQLRVS